MEALRKLIGIEKDLDEISRTIKYMAQDLRAATVGAMHLTCSDESEQECQQAFHRNLVMQVVPRLKFSNQAPFRSANLGARYEWGSARLTENHFATPESAATFKVVVVKINAHVSKDGDSHYGLMHRYHASSYYCGALRALLDEGHEPYLDELRETFHFQGIDRLAGIRALDGLVQPLAAAIVNARMQARKAILDIQDFHPVTPTLYLIVPCVTLNRPVRDTEMLVGFYVADRRDKPSDQYFGLGDDPSKYIFRHERSGLAVHDDQSNQARAARDHREIVRTAWRKHKPVAPKALVEAKKSNHPIAKQVLKTVMAGLIDLAPGAAALFVFAEGLVGIHHAWRAHQLAEKAHEHEEARRILREFEARIEKMTPEQAQQVVAALHEEYGL